MALDGAGGLRQRLTRQQFASAGAVHLAVAFTLLHTAWSDPTRSVVGPTFVDAPGYGGNGIPNGDSLQLVWFMKWTPFALGHVHDPLLTTYLNAPHGANLMWDALMPLAGLILAPVTMIAGPIVSFNLLATLAVALCGLAGTACARRFVMHPLSFLVGGVAFQCSPFVVAHSQGHQSIVLAAAFVPCLLLLVLDVVRQQRSVLSGGVWLGLAAAGTFYTWEETLLSTAVMAAIGVVFAVTIAWRQSGVAWTRGIATVASAGAIAVLLALPGLIIQFNGPMHIAGGAVRAPDVWVIDLQNLVTPTSLQLVTPSRAVSASRLWTGDSFEWGGYLGVPLLIIVAALAVARWRRQDVRWLMAMMVVGVILSLGPSLHVGGNDVHVWLPWSLLTHVPFAQDVLAARMAVFPVLAGVILLAVALESLISTRRHLTAIAAVVAVGVSLFPVALPAQPVRIPAFFTNGAADRISAGAVVLVAPYATPLSPQPMIWQAVSDMRFKMPEGYVSVGGVGGQFLEFPPPTATSTALESVEGGHAPIVDEGLRQAIRLDLRRWRVRTVIVGPMAHENDMVRLLIAVLGRSPSRVAGVAIWWSIDR